MFIVGYEESKQTKNVTFWQVVLHFYLVAKLSWISIILLKMLLHEGDRDLFADWNFFCYTLFGFKINWLAH